jgi:hypothetical protein
VPEAPALTWKQAWWIWAASRPNASEHWDSLWERLRTINEALGFGDDFPRCFKGQCALGAGHEGPCVRDAITVPVS